MEAAKIFVKGQKVRYVISSTKEVVLSHGDNIVSDSEVLLAIVKNPLTCRFDVNQVISTGILKPNVLESLNLVAQPQQEPAPVSQEEPKKPVISKPSFGSMTMAELRDYAEKFNVVIKRGWDKDKIVEVLTAKSNEL